MSDPEPTLAELKARMDEARRAWHDAEEAQDKDYRALVEANQYWHSIPPGVVDHIEYINDIKIVAVKGMIDDWAVYIGAGSVKYVSEYGDKLSEQHARALPWSKMILMASYRR